MAVQLARIWLGAKPSNPAAPGVVGTLTKVVVAGSVVKAVPVLFWLIAWTSVKYGVPAESPVKVADKEVVGIVLIGVPPNVRLIRAE